MHEYKILAHLSHAGVNAEAMNLEVKEVATDGAGLAFIVYPEAVTTMPFPPIW